MDTNTQRQFFHVPYGSKLYGTSTPTSDTDDKVVYVPSLDATLLGYKQEIFKLRFDAQGNKIGVNDTMPDNGIETEYFPLQRFVRDFVQGQTYALEIAHAYLSFGEKEGQEYEYAFVKELVEKFSNSEVYSMTAFAAKQTLDYVKRGERLLVAQGILGILENARSTFGKDEQPRLDTLWITGKTVLDYVSDTTGLPIGKSGNNNREQRTLEMNGRSYLETTTLEHLIGLLNTLVKSYGDRTVEASKKDVDWKSLSHAVRVYQQAIELLQTGTMTFPRLNAAVLRDIKQGKVDLETVKVMLQQLDAQVQVEMTTSKLPKRTEELEEACEFWLLGKLHDLYDLR